MNVVRDEGGLCDAMGHVRSRSGCEACCITDVHLSYFQFVWLCVQTKGRVTTTDLSDMSRPVPCTMAAKTHIELRLK